MTTSKAKSGTLIAGAAVAILFGVLTVASGGLALFGGIEDRAAVGNAVPFVLWFNFMAGFAYFLAGAGLLMRQTWAVWLSIAIFATTVGVFIAFGVHVAGGGAYEMRTAAAMMIRIAVWSAIVLVAAKTIGWR